MSWFQSSGWLGFLVDLPPTPKVYMESSSYTPSISLYKEKSILINQEKNTIQWLQYPLNLQLAALHPLLKKSTNHPWTILYLYFILLYLIRIPPPL